MKCTASGDDWNKTRERISPSPQTVHPIHSPNLVLFFYFIPWKTSFSRYAHVKWIFFRLSSLWYVSTHQSELKSDAKSHKVRGILVYRTQTLDNLDTNTNYSSGNHTLRKYSSAMQSSMQSMQSGLVNHQLQGVLKVMTVWDFALPIRMQPPIGLDTPHGRV